MHYIFDFVIFLFIHNLSTPSEVDLNDSGEKSGDPEKEKQGQQQRGKTTKNNGGLYGIFCKQFYICGTAFFCI